MPRLCELYPGICLTAEEKARKNLSQGKKSQSGFIYNPYTKFTSVICKVSSPVSILTVEPTSILMCGDIADPHDVRETLSNKIDGHSRLLKLEIREKYKIPAPVFIQVFPPPPPDLVS